MKSILEQELKITNERVEEFTRPEDGHPMKSIDDAMMLRNHVINMLEQADVESQDKELKRRLITFVVVGGGFSGVETVGKLNDFVRESIRHYYHNVVSLFQ